MAGELAIWLYGDRVALVDRVRGRPGLTYTEDALDRYPLGTPLLSLSLPVTRRRYSQGTVLPFLDGLLPEGAARRAIAREVGIRQGDTFGLVAALGRDCAGAVVVQDADDPPSPRPTVASAERLGEEAIGELLRNLRSAPLGAGGRTRVSLGGVQEKLLLTRLRDGSWGRPVDGTPSTHILKPEVAGFPHIVANEAFCMRVARRLGAEVATVATADAAGRRTIVVERYDRVVAADGSVERIHQEDLCQATRTEPEAKYEEDGGPSLRQIAEILQSVATPESLERFMQAAALNVLLGNGDAHGKNFSLLHRPSGALALAPLYDLACTLPYGGDRLAMRIDGVQRIEDVTGDRLVAETKRWGASAARAARALAELVAGAPAALEAAREETPEVPAALVTTIEGQLRRLQPGAPSRSRAQPRPAARR